MVTVISRPHPVLRPYVATYVGYHHVLAEDVVHHGLPSSRATVVLAFDEPLDVGWRADGTTAKLWTVASGLHTDAALIRTHGHQHGIQLDLTPAGVRALLGVPVGALARVITDHDDLPLGIRAPEHAAIAAAPDWETRFRLLDHHLRAQLARHESAPEHGSAPEVRHAWQLLTTSRGRCRVEAVARAVGWSRGHLTARFADEYGLSPKQAGRLIRFEHARELVRRGIGLSDVAYAAGYADQAHLTRDWRRLTGITPRVTIAEDQTFVQDATNEPAASRSWRRSASPSAPSTATRATHPRLSMPSSPGGTPAG